MILLDKEAWNMTEKPYPIEQLQPAAFDEWVDFCGRNFTVGPAYFRRHFESDPHRDITSIFVIRDKGILVSSVRVFHRQAWLGNRMVKLGGIGEVSTDPAYRGQGLSKQLLEHAVAYMKSRDFDLSLLGTGYFSHYARHGYRQVKAYRKVVPAGTIGIPEVSFRALGEEDFPAMSALYDHYASQYSLSMVRSMDYWRSWCKGEIGHPKGLFRNGRLIGYICEDKGYVQEIIGEPEDHDCLLSVVKGAQGVLNVPGITQTARPVLETSTNECNMILLLRALMVGEQTFASTEKLTAYLNEHGGITHWAQDSF